ncbi:hypothetical protein DMUE_3077 [Dictyocoela muelleri]|nr:hypothetical protein DMUE_3077 [Dictyocoela muelleri]
MTNCKFNGINLELEDIRLNELVKRALFDSGSSINIITRKILKQLKNQEIRVLDEFYSIRLFNGSIIRSNLTLKLNVCHNNKTINDVFYAIENGIVDIILGRKLIENLEKSLEFPVM